MLLVVGLIKIFSMIGVVACETPAPVRILIVGNSGVGKSTLFNSLVGMEIQATGAGLPVTKAPREHSLSFDDGRLEILRKYLADSGQSTMADFIQDSANVTLIDTEGFGAAPIDGIERSVEDFKKWQEADEARIVSDLESVAPVSIIIFAVPTMTRTQTGFRPVTRLQMETVHLMKLVQRTLEPRPLAYIRNQINMKLASSSGVLPSSLLKVVELLQHPTLDPYQQVEYILELISASKRDLESSNGGGDRGDWDELLDVLYFVLSQPKPNIWDRVVFTLTMVNERVNYMPASLHGRRPEDWIYDFVAGQRNAIYETLEKVLGRPCSPPVVPIGDLRRIKFAHSERLFMSSPDGDWRQDLLIACLSRLSANEQYAFYVVHTDALRQHNEGLASQRMAMRETEKCIKLNQEMASEIALEEARLRLDMEQISEAISLIKSEIENTALKHELHMSKLKVKAESQRSASAAIGQADAARLLSLEDARIQLEIRIRQAAIRAEHQRLEAMAAERRLGRQKRSACVIS